MSAELPNTSEKGRLVDRGEHRMMNRAQFDMMMRAHRLLFERIEASNRAWLAVVQEINKTEADLALRLMRCKDRTRSQALCDAWLRDSIARFTSFNRYALRLDGASANDMPKSTSDPELSAGGAAAMPRRRERSREVDSAGCDQDRHKKMHCET